MERLLFLGALPEPVTGQSLACKVLLNELVKRWDVDVVNLSKSDLRNGMSSVARVREVLGFVVTVWRKQRHARTIYLTVSESIAGNLKDLLFYIVCFPKLGQMYIHLHGGAGLRTIMLGKRGWLRRANEYFVRRLAGAIVLGPRHVDIFASVLPLSRIHVVPNFAEDEVFTDEPRIAAKFASTAPLRLLYLSNLIPGKGYEELLSAFLQLDPSIRERFRLDFAGAFESDRQQRSFRDKISGVPEIHYHGVVKGEAKRALFARAHVFCLPTYYPYEGQPISILEAYAAGCAVITTDHSGIFDVFTPDANGYAVEKRSVESLRAVLERLSAEVPSLQRFATTNFQLASRSFRASSYCDNVIQVLNGHAAPKVS